MSTIKYISYYDSALNKSENRNFVLAATNKMDYICSALNKNGYDVQIISASGTNGKKSVKGKTYDNNGVSVKLFSSFGRGNKIKNIIDIIFLKIQLFFYLFFNIKKDEKVIVYHSLGYMSVISLLKSLKGFSLILEVEEIYSDVIGKNKTKDKELRFFNKADSFIFPTELLNDKINVSEKPFAVIYGTYKTESKRESVFNDGKIHCVYAGTLDPRKGALTAAKAARYLSDDYHIHILGFGSQKDRDLILDEVRYNEDCGLNNLSFDGLLDGEDYIRFIQSCAVGFSTQSPSAQFNATSFPSKVLSYLSNGLRVVCIEIESVKKSKVSDLLYFYNDDSPEAIANVIKDIDFFADYDSREVIELLNKEFIDNISQLMKG